MDNQAAVPLDQVAVPVRLDEKDERAISWLKQQTIPTGSSPLPLFDKFGEYLSSEDDEEYEAFLEKGVLILSAPKSTTKQAMTDYFTPFNVELCVYKQKLFNDIKTVPIKFESHEDAMAALKRWKSDKRFISLDLSVNKRCQSFCIQDIPKTWTANDAAKLFEPFGDVLHMFTPEGVEDMVYLYTCLKEGVTARTVQHELKKVGSPKFRLCSIKPSVTKAEFAKLAEE